MSTTLFLVMAVVETVLVGGMFLLYPRIARRGLLFGVYVGEETWSGPRAREITTGWYRAMIAWLVIALLAEVVLGAVAPKVVVIGFFPLLIVAGFVVLYVRAYFRAREMAVDVPPPAVAIVQMAPEPSLVLPYAALVVGIAAGLVAIAYGAAAYPALPNRVPTHFGISGAPDAWRPKTFFSVMLLPLMTLLMGVFLGTMSLLTARAKRAVRYPHTEISLEAQLRFRTAVTRMLSTVAILVSVMLASMTVSSIRVGLGLEKAMAWPIMGLTVVLLVVALGGTLYIGLRYGQGGARWERQAASAPLTDGLADNRNWILGAFYVNREDPSFLVEDRFGLGYTLNLGNWKAVAAIGGFLVLLMGLVLVALITM